MLIRTLVCAVVPVLFHSEGYAGENGIRVSADNYLYFAHDTHAKDSTFRNLLEDWAAVSVWYGDFEANVVYEAHQPQPSWSSDTTGQGIYERWITFKRKNLTVTAGNFYTLLGKGITLKSFRDREMRYNSNIDGVQFNFSNDFIDLTALGGRPRDLAGYRLKPLEAAELRLTPVQWGFLGVTYVQTTLPSSSKPSSWGSGYVQLQRDFGNIYTEYAQREGGGTAIYSNVNFFAGNVSALVEAANYDRFDISEGIKMFNSPPPALKEHSETFMSRTLPVMFANNHTALHSEVTYAFTDQNNLSLCLSRARATKETEKAGLKSFVKCIDIVNDSADYNDVFAKGNFVIPENIDWVVGTGWQRTPEAYDYNFVLSNDIGLMDNFSTQCVFEHQLTSILLTKRMYYSQLYELTLARASKPRAAVSLIFERTTSQISDRKFWFGTQINWTFYESNEITFFAGNRKAGKICAGGICVNKPEFSGIELTFTSKL
jgi:hypothetical protein